MVVAVLGPLYLTTLLPGVGFHRDTAKYAFLGEVLGTAHPPGYPLYTMLNAVFVRAFPVGTLAWRVNLMSAVFAVITCLVLYRALLWLGISRRAAVCGVLLLGVSFTFWQQAIVAEVYTLATLFMAGILYFLARWWRDRQERHALLALALYALSFSNHLMMILLAPGILVFLAFTGGRRLLGWKLVAMLVVAGLLALSPYLYIFWRTADPSTAYLELEMRDARTFWTGITAKKYRGLMFAFGVREIFSERIPQFWSFVWREFSLLLPAVLYGLGRMWRTGRAPLAAMLGLWLAVVSVFGLGYDVADNYVFFIPAWVAAWVVAAFGVDQAARRLPPPRRSVAFVLLPLVLAATNYAQVDMSEQHLDRRLEAAVDQMPEHSIVFAEDGVVIQAFNYYLKGQGLGEERGLYSYGGGTRSHRAGAVMRYCTGNFEYLYWLRQEVPPDLNIFVYDAAYAAIVRDAGLPTTQVSADLFQVACPGPVAAGSRTVSFAGRRRTGPPEVFVGAAGVEPAPPGL